MACLADLWSDDAKVPKTLWRLMEDPDIRIRAAAASAILKHPEEAEKESVAVLKILKTYPFKTRAENAERVGLVRVLGLLRATPLRRSPI